MSLFRIEPALLVDDTEDQGEAEPGLTLTHESGFTLFVTIPEARALGWALLDKAAQVMQEVTDGD